MAKFHIKGLPYAKVSYETGPQQVLHELFDFNGMSLEFELTPLEETLYPVLKASDQKFRLQKIDEIEVSHYRLVAKKYKWAKKSLIGVLRFRFGSVCG